VEAVSRAERAQAVLDAIDGGVHVARAGREVPAVRVRLCRHCPQQVTLAHLPTGAWCALDREPDGDMVIVGAFVRTRGDHHADAPRYSFHRCIEKETPHGSR
jgi:hypothetical protein